MPKAKVLSTPGGGVASPQDSAVGVGRREGYSETKALNSSTLENKIFYMYREVIITLLISYPQDDVSNFLFGIPNNAGLDKMFSKDGEITQITFDKVVWFLYNAKNYVNNNDKDSFYGGYHGGFLQSISISGTGRENENNFVIKLASESLSLTLCRYLFTIFKTIQARAFEKREGQGGGGKIATDAAASQEENTETEVGFISKTIERIKSIFGNREVLGSFYTSPASPAASPASSSPPQDSAIQHSVDIITGHCGEFERMLFEEIEQFDDDGEPIDPPDATAKNYATILEAQRPPSFNIPANIQMNSDDFSVLTQTAAKLATVAVDGEPASGRRSCSRLVEKQEAAAAAAAVAAQEEEARQKRKEEARLQLIIETKNQLDQALKDAGEDYAGIKIISRKYFSSESGAEFKIETDDATFLLYLAKTLCAITKGSSTMMRNPNIINKKCAVAGFFARLGLLLRSVIAKSKKNIDDDDDDDDDTGGGEPVAAAATRKTAKRGGFRQEGGGGESIFEPIGLRLAIEGIGAANQCFKGVGAIKDIPRIRCYICGELWLDDQKTMECEHIFCVGLAAQYFGLLRSTAFSEQQKVVLSILYAWAHRCCNQLKSNISFMKFKTPPAAGFEFNEDNARELLNKIPGNANFDCRIVSKSIIKTFKTKQRFVDARIPVLGRYCRPLISEINAVRQTIFFDNTQLFAFMGILKIATTALVLFTGSDSATGSLAIKSKDMIELLGLFNPDLKVVNVGASSTGRNGQAQWNKKGKKGGDKSSSPQSGGGLGDVEFSSSPEHLTSKYVQNLSLLLQWDIEHHRTYPRVVKIVHPRQWAHIPPVSAVGAPPVSAVGAPPVTAVVAPPVSAVVAPPVAPAPAAETDDVTVWVQFVDKATQQPPFYNRVEIPVSVTRSILSDILNILLKTDNEYNSFVNGYQITDNPDSFIKILGMLQISSESVFNIGYCIVGYQGCDDGGSGGEQARGQPHHHLLGEGEPENTQDEEDQYEKEFRVVVNKNGPPPPPPNYGDVSPTIVQIVADDVDEISNTFVFNLLAHTHEMNTNTILQALVFDTDEPLRKNALKEAIAIITTSFLSQESLVITKRHASVLQLLILTTVNIGPFTAFVQRTIDHIIQSNSIYVEVSRHVCINVTKESDVLSNEEITDVKRVCFALSPGQVPVPVSDDDDDGSLSQQLFEKFLNEIHEDIFLFLNHCESPRLKLLVGKIKRPSQWSSGKILPVDRMFEFDRGTSISSSFVMKDSSVQFFVDQSDITDRIQRLCDTVGYFFSHDNEHHPFKTIFDDAKNELLDRLVGFLPTLRKESLQEKKKRLNLSLSNNIQKCVEHILTLGTDEVVNDFHGNVQACMSILVNPFLKAAFVVVTTDDEPLDVPSGSESNMGEVVDSSQDPQSPLNRSNSYWLGGPPQMSDTHYSFPDSPVFSQTSKSQEPDMPEATRSFSPPRRSPAQLQFIQDVPVQYFLLFLTADIQKYDSSIFKKEEDNNIIENICHEWTQIFCEGNPHLHNCQIIFIPPNFVLQGTATDGGGRRNKSSIRTRRKLGRNHRRTQHTNKRKHKRSSSKTTRHTTIKHRKSFREHNHTIKRRKKRRRRHQ